MDILSTAEKSQGDLGASTGSSRLIEPPLSRKPSTPISAKLLVGLDPFAVKCGLVILLWLAVIASAISVVYITHATRESLNELELLKKETAQLQVQQGQYLLEQGSFDAPNRVERLARESLNMVHPSADQTILLDAALRQLGD